MPKVVTRKLRAAPDLRGKKRTRTSDGDYQLRECFKWEDHTQNWRIDHLVQPQDYGTLGYDSMSKILCAKNEDDDMITKTEEVIEPMTFQAHTPPHDEYDEGSDESMERYDETQYIFASSSDTTMDETPPGTSSHTWWPESPEDQNYCPVDVQQQVDENLTDDEESDPQYEQKPKFFMGVKKEEPEVYDTKNEKESLRTIRHEVKPRVYCNKREKLSPVTPKVESIRVKKLSDMSNNARGSRGSRSLPLENNTDREFYHDGRRMTRGFIRSIENVCPTINREDHIGKFVWGYCNGWWPGIIVAAEDGGLEPKPDKVCVYWICEDLISLLNEKTQVESFSTNLEIRLLKYLKDDGVKNRKKACFVTLKLFSKYLGITLLKPYSKWAQKHLVGKNHLNDFKFLPIPKNMQQRLYELKEKNMLVTEKNARSSHEQTEAQDGSDKGQQGKFPRDVVRKSTNDLVVSTQDEQHNLPLMDQKPGVIVWGKIPGHAWWPAMIVHNHDCGTKEPNFGCQWIIWYGDYQLSQVHYLNVMKFVEGFQKMLGYITQCRREKYISAVLNACKDHCTRLNYDTSNWTMNDVLAWVSTLNNDSSVSAVWKPNDDRLESRYSIHIAEKLYEMKSNQDISAEREHSIQNCDALKVVFAGILDTLQVLCMICLKISPRDRLQDHPFFECVICKDCVEEYKATIFAYGDDGKSYYCALCGDSNTVVMCSSLDCPRVYCTACLKYLICPSEYDAILIKEPWLCFLCDDSEGLNDTRIFKPRNDWKTKVGQLFHTNLAEETNWDNVWNSDRPRKKMRVLSLFDGIGTGLLVLEKLGIDVEDYYAAEIDPDAETVSSAYFGERIIRLGDVRNITRDVIEAIGPIDLLIGGSPCNDLSIVNPNRLGLHDPNGTGILFFDFVRVKNFAMEVNRPHRCHLFWLYENVASMPREYRQDINDSLQCEPSLIDAADFSPQHRPRFFWNNLPIGMNFPPPDPSQVLQSFLIPNCNRQALVKKIRTVTTRVNSLKQGVSALKPVLSNEVPDSIWITELEMIFGFPKHYTDVKNLSATKRQKLIGQSWSVQTITAILRPLCQFFLTKPIEEL